MGRTGFPSEKRQAASGKRQAASGKRQARSVWAAARQCQHSNQNPANAGGVFLEAYSLKLVANRPEAVSPRAESDRG
ncbi:6-phosphofructokinase [Halopseudomonas pelagia]|uniref:6-phosphofructokinase n=1 Tax=Halopseudomonas pelagia TaxID=553151 RepID=A0ABX6CST0_9GAMM|nr:6-phosphofructokinase [Halopseudomonas pelagia]